MTSSKSAFRLMQPKMGRVKEVMRSMSRAIYIHICTV